MVYYLGSKPEVYAGESTNPVTSNWGFSGDDSNYIGLSAPQGIKAKDGEYVQGFTRDVVGGGRGVGFRAEESRVGFGMNIQPNSSVGSRANMGTNQTAGSNMAAFTAPNANSVNKEEGRLPGWPLV